MILRIRTLSILSVNKTAENGGGKEKTRKLYVSLFFVYLLFFVGVRKALGNVSLTSIELSN